MATIDEPLVNAYVVGVYFDSPVIPNAAGAAAGTPGSFTPAGCDIPEDLAGMSGVTASPATAWTVGQYVTTRTEDVYWNGTAWASGRSPVVGEETYDPGAHTVADVQAYVTEHPEERDSILAAETAGKNRVSLIDWFASG